MNILANFEGYILYAGAFMMAFIISNLMTPVAKKIAFKIGAVAPPKEIGMHKVTMPLGGGMAIYLGFTITVLVLIGFVDGVQVGRLAGLLIGATIITIVGLLDDIYELSPRLRIVFQVLAALIVIVTGTSITSISVPFVEGGQIEFGFLGDVLTLFWIVGITNAVNFLDGLDGLAAGIASIASLVLMVIAVLFGDPLVAGFAILITATLAGSCLGFLPHNFNPATIFMGDTGSTFLGFSLAVISIQAMLKTYTAATLVVGVLILGLPIFDTTFAVVRRLIKRQPVYQGDRGHLHHRLVDKGLSHKKAVLTMYLISGSFGIAAILVVLQDFTFALLIVGFILAVWLGDIGLSYLRKDKLSE